MLMFIIKDIRIIDATVRKHNNKLEKEDRLYIFVQAVFFYVKTDKEQI